MDKFFQDFQTPSGENFGYRFPYEDCELEVQYDGEFFILYSSFEICSSNCMKLWNEGNIEFGQFISGINYPH